MALWQINFESRFLMSNTNVNIIMPDCGWSETPREFFGKEERYPVLWLLHGTHGDCSDWVRKTNIERFASERQIVVVMFSALNSEYYIWPNFACGFDAYHYLLDELMPMVYNWLPVSRKREDNFIAGLSMGGYGAAIYAMSNPELFGGVAGLSGAPVNPEVFYSGEIPMPQRYQNLQNAIGSREELLDSPVNAWERTRELKDSGYDMKLYFNCGDQDEIMRDAFFVYKAYVEELDLKARFDYDEGYAHEWDYWEIGIQRAMDYFGLEKKAR